MLLSALAAMCGRFMYHVPSITSSTYSKMLMLETFRHRKKQQEAEADQCGNKPSVFVEVSLGRIVTRERRTAFNTISRGILK